MMIRTRLCRSLIGTEIADEGAIDLQAWIGNRCNACSDDMPVPKLSICEADADRMKPPDDRAGMFGLARSAWL